MLQNRRMLKELELFDRRGSLAAWAMQEVGPQRLRQETKLPTNEAPAFDAES